MEKNISIKKKKRKTLTKTDGNNDPTVGSQAGGKSIKGLYLSSSRGSDTRRRGVFCLQSPQVCAGEHVQHLFLPVGAQQNNAVNLNHT